MGVGPDDQLALRTRFFDPAFLGTGWMTSASLLYNNARDYFGNQFVFSGNASVPYAVVDYTRFGGSIGAGHDLSITTQLWFDVRVEKIHATVPLADQAHPDVVDDDGVPLDDLDHEHDFAAALPLAQRQLHAREKSGAEESEAGQLDLGVVHVEHVARVKRHVAEDDPVPRPVVAANFDALQRVTNAGGVAFGRAFLRLGRGSLRVGQSGRRAKNGRGS